MKTFLLCLFCGCCALWAWPGCTQLPEIETGPSAASAEVDPARLTRHWVRSYEEEAAESGVEVFRPDGFRAFPPSRFRMQYVFEAGGDCEWFYLAPNDGHHFRPGTWRLTGEEEDVLRIQQGEQTVTYRILELTDDLLRMTPV